MEALEGVGRRVKQASRAAESGLGTMKNMMSSIALVGDARHFQEGRNQFDKLRASLDSRNEKEKLEAMKTITAMMTLNRDVQAFFPHVVKNVVVESMEVKKLVYMYVVNYASQNPDLALLSISSFQRDMQSSNPLVRAKALQAMSSMRVGSVAHLIIIQLKQAVKDSSPYVRRTAAHVIPAVDRMDQRHHPDLVAMVTQLLTDDAVVVLSAGLFAFRNVCPRNFEAIHPNFEKICHLLADMDEWGQYAAIDILTRYARNQFTAPMGDLDDEEDKEQSEDDDDDRDNDDLFGFKKKSSTSNIATSPRFMNEAVLDRHHKMLIDAASNLLHSTNSGVILAVATLLFYCGTRESMSQCVKALMSHINRRPETSYVVLANIASMARERPELFSAHYKSFFIRASEPHYVKELKLDLLSQVATDGNISTMIREFQSYMRDPDISFRCATIDAMGRCASSIADVAEQVMRVLMDMVSSGCQEVVASSVIVIRQIVQRDPEKYSQSLLSLLRLLFKTNVPSARAAIVWIIGEYRAYIADYAPDALRMLAKNFIREEDQVKTQILNLAVKVMLADPEKVTKLFKYILDMCKYDRNYDIRDRARLIRSAFYSKSKRGDPEVSSALRVALQDAFVAVKPVPAIVSPFEDRDRFVLGTLSHMVVHSAGDNYEPLEDWPEEAPDTSHLRAAATGVGTREEKAWDGEFSDGSNSITDYSSDDDDSYSDEYSDDEDSDEDESDDSGDSDDSDESEYESDESGYSEDEDDDEDDPEEKSAAPPEEKNAEPEAGSLLFDPLGIFDSGTSNQPPPAAAVEEKVPEVQPVVERKRTKKSRKKPTKKTRRQRTPTPSPSPSPSPPPAPAVEEESSSDEELVLTRPAAARQAAPTKPVKKSRRDTKKQSKRRKEPEPEPEIESEEESASGYETEDSGDSPSTEEPVQAPTASTQEDIMGDLMGSAVKAPANVSASTSASALDFDDLMSPSSENRPSAVSGPNFLDDIMGPIVNTGDMDTLMMTTDAKEADEDEDGDVYSVISGATGEILNHTHSGGLQIDFEFMRTQSAHGPNFNLIKLRFENLWNESVENISLHTPEIEDRQEFRDIPNGKIARLSAGAKTSAQIHIKFGGSSEFKFKILTNKGSYMSSLSYPVGERMAPKMLEEDVFISKQRKMSGMEARKIQASCTFEETTQRLMRACNVAHVQSSEMTTRRLFAGELLDDRGDVLFEVKRDGDIAQCSVHCKDFMLIHSLADFVKKELN